MYRMEMSSTRMTMNNTLMTRIRTNCLRVMGMFDNSWTRAFILRSAGVAGIGKMQIMHKKTKTATPWILDDDLKTGSC
jgi:hypothetical protein